MKKFARLFILFSITPFLLSYAFRFDPTKWYMAVCAIGSALLLPIARSRLVAHWTENEAEYTALKLAPQHVFFQAIAYCGGVFILTCYFFGMIATQLFGTSVILTGKIVSIRSSGHCSKSILISLDNGGYTRMCPRGSRLGAGSVVAIRVRHSLLGQYVE